MSVRTRTLTAVPLLLLVFAVVQWGSAPVFFGVVQLFIAAGLWEFYNLARLRRWRPMRAAGLLAAALIGASFYAPAFPLGLAVFIGLAVAGVWALVSFDSLEKVAVFPVGLALTVFGAFYVAFPVNFLHWIRLEHGPYYLYFLFAIIFIGDTGAFFVGKAFGRHKMTPMASPNKSWEGAAGGILFAVLAAAAVRALLLKDVGLPTALLTGVAVHASAQFSDPIESLFKRAAGVKDSSNLLPGHGGFLDRLDSFLFAAPVFYYLVHFFWK